MNELSVQPELGPPRLPPPPPTRFIASDLRGGRRRAGIDVKDDRRPLLGGVQIVSGVNHGADRPNA